MSVEASIFSSSTNSGLLIVRVVAAEVGQSSGSVHGKKQSQAKQAAEVHSTKTQYGLAAPPPPPPPPASDKERESESETDRQTKTQRDVLIFFMILM